MNPTPSDQASMELVIPEGVRRELPAGARLVHGDRRLRVSRTIPSVRARETTIPVEVEHGMASDESLPVFYLEYDYAELATTTKVPADLLSGSLLVRAVAVVAAGTTSDAKIVDQRVTSGSTLSCQWTAASPGRTLVFDGRTRCVSDIPQAFAAVDDFTLEAWIKPAPTRVASCLVQQSSDTQYALECQPREFLSALEFDGVKMYGEIARRLNVRMDESLTLEAWIRPNAADGIRSIVTACRGETQVLAFLRINQDEYEFGVPAASATTARAKMSAEDSQGREWIHVAGVWDALKGRMTLLCNGVVAKDADVGGPHGGTITHHGDSTIADAWRLGGSVDGGFFQGAIDDVRVWRRARAVADIAADRFRRQVGNETGLAACWNFESGRVNDLCASASHGIVLPTESSRTPIASPLSAFGILVNANGHHVQSRSLHATGHWMHVAAVFEQSSGLQFDGETGYVEFAKDESLNIDGDLTIELNLTIDSVNRSCGILAKGIAGAADSKKAPFALELDFLNRLVFSFGDEKGNWTSYTAVFPLLRDRPYHVAVTRKAFQRHMATPKEVRSSSK